MEGRSDIPFALLRATPPGVELPPLVMERFEKVPPMVVVPYFCVSRTA